MSSMKRLASKRKATVSRPSYSTPDILRERPSRELSRKEIVYERIFPTYDLDKQNECRWTMDYLGRNNYLNITVPFADEVYPRLVRLFYQRLKYGATEEGELFIEFTVDGHHGRITTSDMGVITRLPAVYSETLRHLKPPLVFPNDESILEFILEDFGFSQIKESGGHIMVSTLPERVWLLDKILKENIYPLGNYNERRIDLLLALYSAHEGYFYSIPYLLMLGIQKVSQELKAKSSPGNTKHLPYGFFVTAILRYTKYFLDQNEPIMDMDSLYPLTAWTSCYKKLLFAKTKKIEDEERRRTPVGINAATDTSAPGTSRVFTFDIGTRLKNMETRQDDMFCRQGVLLNQQADMMFLMNAIAKKQLGDEFEELANLERRRAEKGKAPASDYDSEEEEDVETNSNAE